MEILVGFLGGNFRHTACDADLTIQLAPIKHQPGPLFRLQFRGFAAVVVGEKHEAALIDAFHQHQAHRRLAGGTHGGQCHGVRFHNSGALGGAEPAAELLDGIGGKIFFAKWFEVQIPVYGTEPGGPNAE